MKLKWEHYFEPHIIDRGLQYVEEDRVSGLEISENIISADVLGTDNYHVTIHIDNDEITDMACTCPYAQSGLPCKHMVAVLFSFGDDLDMDNEYDDENNDFDCPASSRSSSSGRKQAAIEELINSIPPKDLKPILIEVLLANDRLKNTLKLKYHAKFTQSLMASLKKEVDNIFYEYSDDWGFIGWQSSYDFCFALIDFLDTKIPLIMERAQWNQAFDLVNYVFWKVGNVDIDDSDGGTGILSEKCYDYWEKLLGSCDEKSKSHMEKWFRKNHSSDYVIDYMQDYIQDFYKRHCRPVEEIRSEMETFDKIIEEHQGQTDCGTVISMRYGDQDIALLRIECMKQLGMSEQEIAEYRQNHRNFYSIRELEIQEAIESGETSKAIQILQESKILDAANKGRVKEHSCKLISIFRDANMLSEYRNELLYQLLNCHQNDLTYYHLLKETMGSSPDWNDTVDKLLASDSLIYYKCDILKEESRYDDLMLAVEKNGYFILESYEDVLRDRYPERVINIYKNNIMTEIERAANRKEYKYLVRRLKKIALCKNGYNEACAIANLWKQTYYRRKALIDELRKAGF